MAVLVPSLYPPFTRVPVLPPYQEGSGSPYTMGTAATYNASELAAWNLAVQQWLPSGQNATVMETGYLQNCLVAAVTAGYTPGSLPSGASQPYGVATSIINRLRALGVQVAPTT